MAKLWHDKYLVKPGSDFKIAEADPDETLKIGKEKSKEEMQDLGERLNELQQVLYAENRHKVLIVFQAMDTGGKDGTIRSIFRYVNPQGVKVTNFGKPSEEELEHDYLWRIHEHTPKKREIAVFNRSHYEDVLVVRVHGLVPQSVWSKRYQQITNFERMLAEEGATILKFYLNIDKDEQKKRLQERLDVPEKRWKFNIVDLAERKLWDKYMKAYEDAIAKTSAEFAPWYVVPANRNWVRNYIVSSVIVSALESLKMNYPSPMKGIEKIVID